MAILVLVTLSTVQNCIRGRDGSIFVTQRKARDMRQLI